MRTVYKYPLLSPTATIELPRDAVVLSAGVQEDQIVIWVLVDPRPPAHARHTEFLALNTGTPFPDSHILNDFRFLNTVTSSTGIVWHVFCERGD